MQGGAAAILAFVVILFLLGKIVPRSALLDERKNTDRALTALATSEAGREQLMVANLQILPILQQILAASTAGQQHPPSTGEGRGT